MSTCVCGEEIKRNDDGRWVHADWLRAKTGVYFCNMLEAARGTSPTKNWRLMVARPTRISVV